ncbi:MAG: hypothetical protein WCJ37_13450 [Syntrophus sp. (in: bacteria)]
MAATHNGNAKKMPQLQNIYMESTNCSKSNWIEEDDSSGVA